MSKLTMYDTNGKEKTIEANVEFDWSGITFPSTPIVKIPTKEKLRPARIIYNGRTTIVYWNDDTKTASTCDVNDTFDEKMGFASCLLKKMYGSKVHKKRLFDRMIEGAERHNATPNSLKLSVGTNSTKKS